MRRATGNASTWKGRRFAVFHRVNKEGHTQKVMFEQTFKMGSNIRKELSRQSKSKDLARTCSHVWGTIKRLTCLQRRE